MCFGEKAVSVPDVCPFEDSGESDFEAGLKAVEVAAITGHKDLRMLGRYTHLRAEDLARKLAGGSDGE